MRLEPLPTALPPADGATASKMTPGGARYVNAFASAMLWPSLFSTLTLTAPAACEGVVAVIVVALTTVTAVAAVPPMVTVGPAMKPVPVIVTAVPPLVVPEIGATLVTVGAGNGDE